MNILIERNNDSNLEILSRAKIIGHLTGEIPDYTCLEAMPDVLHLFWHELLVLIIPCFMSKITQAKYVFILMLCLFREIPIYRRPL